MSHLTDKLRAPYREAQGEVTVPGQMFDEIVAANPQRRTLLKNSFGLSMLSVFGASTLLTACGGSDDDDNDDAPSGNEPGEGGSKPTPGPDYSVTFTPLADKIVADTVTVPAGYVAEVLYSAGDKCMIGSVGYAGVPQSYPATETQSGGQHDGMHFYALPGVDPNQGGLLVLNHESLDDETLNQSVEGVKTRLSNVGVSVIEIARGANGAWAVKTDSRYNKRYTGNTVYNVSGPAKSVVGDTVVGTLNNCASGDTPWGTYLTCEETLNNYHYKTGDAGKPADQGYGWVVEIDPQNPDSTAVKRTAMGRFSHENTAFMLDENNRVAFYMGDDTTPGCIYKFVPSKPYDPANRAANMGLLDEGTLYAARFNDDGSGNWVELTVGKNNLTAGATDPGNFTQVASGTVITGKLVNFNTQADVLVNTGAAARVAGATLMDRPEWITVGVDKTVYCTLTNNGSRKRTSAANPRVSNSHGHIIRWHERGDSPLATTFEWDLLLLAGRDKADGVAANLTGNVNGDTFSSPDGIRVDPKGRLWVQTDAGTSASTTDFFGNNSMYYIDQKTGESKRFLVGPLGCEITGIAYTPDLTTFFINIQHPNQAWNTLRAGGGDARSATVVVRRTDGKPVGA
ncbi:PhoX family phosphatase [Achromobacter aegrifaciens]|uniref:PhoX family protein n=1 Tax=Achromobacter aegrifaciens TaxID=1287736 RepID=UPI0027B91171|nr:PhoX family phosphatase [Achromobacter aegrifaciens]WLW61209.1 PhoX family phosphatase [Achromobacter aegrifaciens]